MDVVVSRCAGIDIGKSEVIACVRVPGPDGERVSEVRTFTAALTGEVERLAHWLAEGHVTHVEMKATGQYWKPVCHVLGQGGFELMLVNARHVKMVPGRKTDVADAAWLAELLEHDLLRGEHNYEVILATCELVARETSRSSASSLSRPITHSQHVRYEFSSGAGLSDSAASPSIRSK